MRQHLSIPPRGPFTSNTRTFTVRRRLTSRLREKTQSTLNVVAYFLMKVQLLNTNVETHKPSRSRFAYTVTITRREIVKK